MLIFISCTKKRDVSKLEYLKPFRALSKDALFIVLSSSIEGYVESCGCTSAPLGDIARFAQVFLDIKTIAKKNVLFIDAGNLLFDQKTRNMGDLCQDNARLKLLLETFKDLGLRQTIVGPFDNARGPTYRDQWYEKIKVQAFKNALEQRIVDVHDYKVGLLGVRELPKKEEILAIIDSMRKKKVQLVMVLSQIPKNETEEFFKNFSGLDVVIQGQISSFEPQEPKRLSPSGPIFIEAGRQEHYFPVLVAQNLMTRDHKTLVLDNSAYLASTQADLIKARIRGLKAQIEADSKNKEFLQQRLLIAQEEQKNIENKVQKKTHSLGPSIMFQAIPLSKDIDPLKSVNEELESYRERIPSLVLECEKNIECPKANANEARYVGAEACKSCHIQAYEVWKKAIFIKEGQNEKGEPIKREMGHSKAWQTLVLANKDNDRSCIGCHSIGFMKPGGYCKASDVSFRKDVQCESCHGPGSIHAKDGKKDSISLPNEQTCRSCHHVPHIDSYDSFNYEQRLKKILGPGHGERLLKELSHKAKI